MRYKKEVLVMLSLIVVVAFAQCRKFQEKEPNENPELVRDGKHIFRYDTFGDEDFWSGLLHIDKAILGKGLGGFGNGVSPKTALAVGLKVDANALPAEIVAAFKAGQVNLDDPKTTVELLKLDAVVGVKGNFDAAGNMKSMGITCALCHSTVDNSFAPGIGKRLDGWPNRDLDVGTIISLTNNAKPIADLLHVDEPVLRNVLSLWGPGRFAPVLFLDGKAFRPDGKVAANVLPAAFGLRDIKLTTYTGWGDISYWNNFVGTLEMHGKGTFIDPRINDPVKYPIAAENNLGSTINNPDLLTSKLPALKAYQHSISAPKPPQNSFDHAAAVRGKALFISKAKCASCHTPPLLADNKLHAAAELGIDDFESQRSPTGKYRTTPLGGLFTRMKGGFYHDGRFATLSDVVDHYNDHFNLKLSQSQKNDLVEYLKSL